ncbi:hypothetical protein [Chromobacterium violaceum]|uniref:hypothetical protein n=1 Tax=Chromobacterium violaceum TaxID=536 RepID=UPI0005BA40EB|nr:hypothetical protein [Chromobacterium violaceum]
MANLTKLTPEKKEKFLEVLADTANVTKAANTIKMARRYMYELKAKDKRFSAAWDDAVVHGTAALEDEAARRAMEGTLRPVFYKGEKCGTIREYSDTLLIFLLKARDPEKYADRVKQELTGKGGGPLQAVTVNTNDPMEAAKIYADLMKS